MPHAPSSDDQEFLDALLDEALRRIEEGAALEIDELVAERPQLRAQIEEIVRLARETSVVGGWSMPSLSGYSNLAELGRGGMGTVYLARQDRLAGRLVALKVLPISQGMSSRSQERFIREVEALGRIRHPHVITIFDVIQSDGVLAYAMEWIDGLSLAEWIQERAEERRSKGSKERRVEVPAISRSEPSMGAEAAARSTAGTEAGRYGSAAFVCRLGVEIARALGAVHRAGLLHRDVKPSNILIRRDGTPVLSDFGLVRVTDTTLTEPGLFAGTPAYSPPEQLRGDSERIDARSDVYALGVTLHHALALRPPFRADRLPDLLSAAEAGRYTALRRIDSRIPADLETIIAKAMDADPARRYQTADELADDLERLLNLQPIKARPAGWVTRSVKLMRRNRRSLVFAVAASTVTLILATLAAIYLFVVPGWVQAHVREARLELLAPVWANAVFSSEFWGASQAGWYGARVARDSLEKSLGHYDAALRLAPFDTTIGAEREIVANAFKVATAQSREVTAGRESAPALPHSRLTAPSDPRSAGLQAYLEGDIDGALRAWGEYERKRPLTAEPDPLVEAALGILYLSRAQPARAYPRLRTAFQAFPNVGFITTYLADAALRCGDVDAAEQFLASAAGMPRLDPLGGLTRVRASLLAARGRDAEAEALYRSAEPRGPLVLDFAAFLESRGRWEEALEKYHDLAQRVPGGQPRRAFVAAMDRWWARQSAFNRLRLIRETLDGYPHIPYSLVSRLRLYLAAKPPSNKLSSTARFAFSSRSPFGIAAAWAPFPEICSALYPTFFSPPLQRADLTALANILEVNDMSMWNRTVSQPRILKEVRFASQRWPVLRPLARCGDLIAVVLLGALAAQTASGQCTDPPCFQGLGDLPGGNYFSAALTISTDGTTVGGGSATAASGSGGEAFLWRADSGMVYLGDLPGHLNHGGVNGLSADGTIAVGQSSSGNGNFEPYEFGEAFRWTQQDGMVGLGDVGGGHFLSGAHGISDDGTIIAGWVTTGGCCGSDFRRAATWSNGAWTIRATSTDTIFTALSRNGQWACGYLAFGGTNIHVLRWSESTGAEDLGAPPGRGNIWSYAASNDGTVVGYSSAPAPPVAFRSTSAAGFQTLDDFPGGAHSNVAMGISADASIVIGWGTTAAGGEAALWDESLHIQRVVDVLASNGVSVPSGWTLTEANGITIHNGVVSLCGNGLNPLGQPEAWIARYSLPCTPCDVDCNGTVNPFDIQPFLDALSPTPPTPCSPCAGDADGNGTVNPFDINAFLECLD